MEYKKIINLLHNTLDQPFKFRRKNWVEVNDESHGKYSQIRFKTSILRSSLCNYWNAHILVKGTMAIPEEWLTQQARQVDEINKGIIFYNFAPFTDFISKINYTQIDNAKDIGVLMPTYNLLECSYNVSKISESFRQYYRVYPNANLEDSESFKFKIKKVGSTLMMTIQRRLK